MAQLVGAFARSYSAVGCSQFESEDDAIHSEGGSFESDGRSSRFDDDSIDFDGMSFSSDGMDFDIGSHTSDSDERSSNRNEMSPQRHFIILKGTAIQLTRHEGETNGTHTQRGVREFEFAD